MSPSHHSALVSSHASNIPQRPRYQACPPLPNLPNNANPLSITVFQSTFAPPLPSLHASPTSPHPQRPPCISDSWARLRSASRGLQTPTLSCQCTCCSVFLSCQSASHVILLHFWRVTVLVVLSWPVGLVVVLVCCVHVTSRHVTTGCADLLCVTSVSASQTAAMRCEIPGTGWDGIGRFEMGSGRASMLRSAAAVRRGDMQLVLDAGRLTCAYMVSWIVGCRW